MSGRRCPGCGGKMKEPPKEEAFPFCSMRCRTLDLGNWLDGRYRMPDPDDAPPAWPPADE